MWTVGETGNLNICIQNTLNPLRTENILKASIMLDLIWFSYSGFSRSLDWNITSKWKMAQTICTMKCKHKHKGTDYKLREEVDANIEE